MIWKRGALIRRPGAASRWRRIGRGARRPRREDRKGPVAVRFSGLAATGRRRPGSRQPYPQIKCNIDVLYQVIHTGRKNVL